MAEDSKKAEAVFIDSTRPECRIVTVEFHFENDEDALEIARDNPSRVGLKASGRTKPFPFCNDEHTNRDDASRWVISEFLPNSANRPAHFGSEI